MMPRPRSSWPWMVAGLIALALAFIPPVHGAGKKFFDSLRLAKPQSVTAAVTTPTAGVGRQIDDAVVGMVAATPTIAVEEPATAAPNVDSALKVAGFRAPTITARHDVPSISVIGARELTAKIDPGLLRTVLDEAGEGHANVPAGV